MYNDAMLNKSLKIFGSAAVCLLLISVPNIFLRLTWTGILDWSTRYDWSDSLWGTYLQLGLEVFAALLPILLAAALWRRLGYDFSFLRVKNKFWGWFFIIAILAAVVATQMAQGPRNSGAYGSAAWLLNVYLLFNNLLPAVIIYAFLQTYLTKITRPLTALAVSATVYMVAFLNVNFLMSVFGSLSLLVDPIVLALLAVAVISAVGFGWLRYKTKHIYWIVLAQIVISFVLEKTINPLV
jgi:membrane protease YdiL (CAAX protease family)